MSIEEQLRALGDRLDEVQAPITVDELERAAGAQVREIPSSPGRQLLLIAAVVVLIVGGVLSLVALSGAGDDPVQPVDSGAVTVPEPTALPTTTATTSSARQTTDPVGDSAPTTAIPQAPPGWSGGLLDDLDAGSLRPLDSLGEGDVVVPSGPSGWRIERATWTGPDAAVGPEFIEWELSVIEARPDQRLGHVLYLTQSREPICVTTLGCRPSGDSATVDGVVWEAIEVEEIPEDDPEFVDATTLRARVGDRWIALSSGAPQALRGRMLDDPQVIELLEGLRAGSPDDVAAIGEACWQCGVVGAEGDPFASVGSPTVTTTLPDSAVTSEPRAQAPSQIDPDTVRPLTDLVEGDVVIPTYVPEGLALERAARIYEGVGASEFSFSLEPTVHVRVWEWDEAVGPLGPAELDDPNHPPVEIAGLTWGWNDFESARIANIGQFSVWVSLHGLDRLEAERFIEGLRAAPIEQFPGPIAVDGPDGLSVVELDDLSDAEIVASDDRFELAAVRVGDEVCTKLEETVVPVTATFSANCWELERLHELGIVDLYALDGTDGSANAKYLVIGLVDSADIEAARITSPSGESVVVATGPVNAAIDGRFFLARLELDDTAGIRVDQFTIEDASP